MKYAIKKKNKDVRKATIEKTGHVITFTLEQVEEHEKELNGTLKELKAKKDVDVAKMANVSMNHPKVMKLSEVELVGAFIYATSKSNVEQISAKAAEIKAQLREYAAEKKEIYRQLGISDEGKA